MQQGWVSQILKALACSAVLMFSTLSFAQTGSIGGTVIDRGGAVVVGAEITIHNLSTNAYRMVPSNNTGNYSVTNLPAATYEVIAKKAGFKTARLPDVQLAVDQAATVDIEFVPGTVSEEVQVRADLVPAIDLDTSQVSNLVDQRRMQDLPLVTRDSYQLVLLSPGTIQSNSILGGFSVNGARERNNNFLLDGSDNNDTSVPGQGFGLASLNPDATQEFRVITNSFMPEFGRNNGAIIDVVTRSGSNAFHGAAYWFGRYNALGARDYFNHNLDENGNMEPQNPYVRNQFGFSAGGPIIKDKTFFFVNNEWHRYRTALTNTSVVPTAAFKSGIFDFTDPNGETFPVDLTDPSSPNNAQGVPLSPVMGQILSLYPDPNAGAVDDMRGLYRYPSTSQEDSWDLITKLDHHINNNHNLSLHYAYRTVQDPNPFHDEFLPGLGSDSIKANAHVAGLSLTSILTPTLVNDARFGFNRLDAPFQCSGLDVLNSVGEVDEFGRARDFNLPALSGFGCQALSDTDSQWRRTGTWSLGDSLSWSKGSHIMKFGGDARFIFEDSVSAFFSRDFVTFNGFSSYGFPWANIDPSNPCDPGNFDFSTNGCGSSLLQDMSDMMFGYMDSEFQYQYFDHSGNRMGDDLRKFRQHEYDFFVQDSWKILPNFTLNYGLRYQFDGVPHEANNNISNLFVDPSGPAPFTFELVGPGTGRQLYDNNFKDFEPRIGFAWDPFKQGKTSVRAAFGIYHDRVFGNLAANVRGNPPFQQAFFGIPLFESGGTPETTPFPDSLPTTPVVEDFAGLTPTLFPRHFPMPYSENWNFGFQQELARNLTLDLNYVGAHGVHQLRVVDGNPPDQALVQQLIDMGFAPSDLQFSNLYFGAENPFLNLPFDPVHNNAFFAANMNQAVGGSVYHGLQVNLTKRFSDGFQVQGAYTYSHAIDDASDPIYATERNRSYPRNSLALGNERGNSGFDIRHRLVVNYVWELPFGRGRSHLNTGTVGTILSGWRLSGITTMQTGLPYDVFYGTANRGDQDSEHTGSTARGFIIGDTSRPADHDRTQTGPSRSGFCVSDLGCSPPFGVPGNSGRSPFFGPGAQTWDVVVAKNTTLTERFNLETRFEFYNLFNHTQFDQPDNLLGDAQTFGFSTNTVSRSDGTTSARQMQVAMRLNF